MEYKGGAADGNRQRKLEKQRQAIEEESKRRKEQIIKENTVNTVGERFTTQQEDYASALAKDTIGLVTLQEFELKKRNLEEKRAAEVAAKQIAQELSNDKLKKKKGLETKVKANKLSFDVEETEEDKETAGGEQVQGDNQEDEVVVKEQEEDHEPPLKKAKLGKNPFVDTSFLPDRDRDLEEKAEREKLAAEWRQKQEEIKKEEIEITYSYWDGSGHRSTVRCKKGDTIAHFLEKARQQFPELRGVSVDNLLYVKEDLIIPQHHSFYDFIINKARGKSGPLFHFDVHEDIRLVADARFERDESHAGKVVERRWYERNKHIFPASRWEVYDPEKTYGNYTIGDRNKTR